MRTITLKSYDSQIISLYCTYLRITLKRLNLPYTYCHTKQVNEKLTLLKSPHVYKKFKEHYRQDIYTVSFSLQVRPLKLQKIVSLLNIKEIELFITLS